MTDKQMIIDCKNLCENYSEEVGCYNTFNGSCIQEQCFTYKLLQQLQSKEQECEELKEKNKVLQKLVSELEYSVQTGIELNARYCSALDEIEDYCHKQISLTGDLPFKTTESDILDIINKVKGEINE